MAAGSWHRPAITPIRQVKSKAHGVIPQRLDFSLPLSVFLEMPGQILHDWVRQGLIILRHVRDDGPSIEAAGTLLFGFGIRRNLPAPVVPHSGCWGGYRQRASVAGLAELWTGRGIITDVHSHDQLGLTWWGSSPLDQSSASRLKILDFT